MRQEWACGALGIVTLDKNGPSGALGIVTLDKNSALVVPLVL